MQKQKKGRKAQKGFVKRIFDSACEIASNLLPIDNLLNILSNNDENLDSFAAKKKFFIEEYLSEGLEHIFLEIYFFYYYCFFE
jgi:hypothetical protein